MSNDQFLVLLLGIILVLLAVVEFWKPQFKAVF
jgi:hypothetical protein